MSRPGAAWGATVGALIVYATAVAGLLPRIIYSPTVNAWTLHEIPGEPGIKWFGWMLWMLAGGVLGALAGAVLRGRPPWWVAWGLGAIALVALAVEQRHWFGW